jgi:hypothetical protein
MKKPNYLSIQKRFRKSIICVSMLALPVSFSATAGPVCDWMNEAKSLMTEELGSILATKNLMDEAGAQYLSAARNPSIQAAIDTGELDQSPVPQEELQRVTELRKVLNAEVRDYRDLIIDWNTITTYICEDEE